MNFIKYITSLGLVAMVKSAITPNPPLNVTVTNTDSIQLNISQLFNLGGGGYPNCSTYQSPGDVYTYNSSIATKTISTQYVNEPEIANFISNTSLFSIFDNNNVMIQNITLDGMSFTTTVYASFGMPGTTQVCTDVILNSHLSRLYVACQTDFNATTGFYIYLYELDATTGATLNSITVPQNATLKVNHRMQLVLAPMYNAQTRRTTTYLFAYDQGFAGGLGTSNKWMLVLAGADAGNLNLAGVADLSATGLAVIYDVFSVRGGMLVTGKNSSQTTAIMAMADCDLYFNGQGAIVLQCDPNIEFAPLGTYYGYIGVMNTGQYVEVNANANNTSQDYISICDFFGPWGTANYIDVPNCRRYPTVNIPDDVAISTIDGNVHQIVINYVFFDGTYAGYTVENFDLRTGWYDLDDSLAPHYIPIGKSLIRLNSQQFDIFRMVTPYYYVQTKDMNPGSRMIRIDCIDPSQGNQTVSGFVNMTVLANMNDGVRVLNQNPFYQISMYEGQDYWTMMPSWLIQGNDLRTIISPLTPLGIKGDVLDNRLINIDFDVVKGSTAFVELHFSDNYAVALDVNNYIIFFTCNWTGILHFTCTEEYAKSFAGTNIHLKPDIETVFENLFVWGTDAAAEVTYLWFYDGISNVVQLVSAGVADDCAASTANGVGYVACAFSQLNIVRGWNFTGTNFQNSQRLPDINVINSQREYFCPIDIEFDMDTSEMIEILSVCPNQDQRILRYRYPPTQNRQTGAIQINLVATIPINFAYKNPDVCSMGTEFIIKATLGNQPTMFSKAMQDDRNMWMFNVLTDDINVGQIQRFHCVREVKAVSTYSRDANQNAVITTYFGNRQWRANQRIFTTMRANSATNPEFSIMNMYKHFHSYNFMGMVIHTMSTGNPSDSMAFGLTYLHSKILHLSAPYGLGNSVSTVEIDVVPTSAPSPGRTASLFAQVTTTAANQTGAVSVVSTMNSIPTGDIQLENYVKFKGPVSHSWIQHEQALNIHLQGRLAPVSNYIPPSSQNQYTFNWLWTVDSTTIALHRFEPYNTSVFTFFNSINNFVGTYTPPEGVNSFHFANFNTTGFENCTLIAFSTAAVYGQRLDFLVMNGSQRLSIAFSNESTSMSYDSIEVRNYGINSNQFLVFAHNRTDGFLAIYWIDVIGTYPNIQIQVDLMTNETDIGHFATVVPTNSEWVWLFVSSRHNPSQLDHYLIERLAAKGKKPKMTKMSESYTTSWMIKNTLTKPANPQATPQQNNYPITDLVARIHDDNKFYILINTESVYFFEFIFDSVNPSVPLSYYYMKVPGWDGRFLDGNKQHIMQITGDPYYIGEFRLDFYLRQVNGGDGLLYWSQHNDQFRPASLTTCSHNNSHVQMATAFPSMPLVFLKLQPMVLTVSPGATFDNVAMYVQGLPHASPIPFNLSSIIKGGGGDDGGSSTAWWPFVLIIGLLIAASIGFIVYKGMKDNAKEDPENYESMKAESKA